MTTRVEISFVDIGVGSQQQPGVIQVWGSTVVNENSFGQSMFMGDIGISGSTVVNENLFGSVSIGIPNGQSWWKRAWGKLKKLLGI